MITVTQSMKPVWIIHLSATETLVSRVDGVAEAETSRNTESLEVERGSGSLEPLVENQQPWRRVPLGDRLCLWGTKLTRAEWRRTALCSKGVSTHSSLDHRRLWS